MNQLISCSFDIIVCDEGHKLKNTNAKISEAIKSLPCKRKLILSGTPIQNDLEELYNMTDLVNPGLLGSLSKFKVIFMIFLMIERIYVPYFKNSYLRIKFGKRLRQKNAS